MPILHVYFLHRSGAEIQKLQSSNSYYWHCYFFLRRLIKYLEIYYFHLSFESNVCSFSVWSTYGFFNGYRSHVKPSVDMVYTHMLSLFHKLHFPKVPFNGLIEINDLSLTLILTLTLQKLIRIKPAPHPTA